MTGKAPYKNIISHGFVLDGNGRKMSKSLGNVIVPSKVQKQLGSDILRLWVASVDYQADVRISDDILKQTSESYRKIRNTFRFLLANLADFDPAKDRVKDEDLQEVDRYMLYRLQQVLKGARDNYEHFEFAPVINQVHNFCAVDLSSFYLDFAKDILYIEAADHPRRRSIQTGYYEILTTLVQVLAPIIPHTAEEVWEYIPGVEAETVHFTDIPEPRKVADSEGIVGKWDHFMEVRDDVLKALEEARAEKVIGKSLEAKITLAPLDEETKQVLENVADLHQYFIVSEAVIASEKGIGKEYDYVEVAVEKHPGETCERCWVVSETVGEDKDHPTLCARCASVVKENYTN